MMIQPVLSFNKLLNSLLCLKTKRYFYIIKNNKECFTGNVETDINRANEVIKSVESNNSGHVTSSAFIYAYNKFYGIAFNPKYINQRSSEVSKMTSRLDYYQIEYIKHRILDWVKDANNIKNNTKQYIKLTRIRFLYVFEALLYTGMRAGELASINFKETRLNRFVTSDLSGTRYAEIVINTEKSGKKREIYLPENVYNFFLKDNKRFDVNYISHTFVTFRQWANLPFFLSSHMLRRTKATTMHEFGVDEATISLVLGNTPDVVRRYYIISSSRNFDACDIGNCYEQGIIRKTNNIYFNNDYFIRKGLSQDAN